MDTSSIRPVVDTWTEQYETLGVAPSINYVQIFENRGEEMGASNPHPHCQIWSGRTLPNEHQKELASQRAYREKHGSCLLCDYVKHRGAFARADRVRERRVPGRGSVLGGVAVRGPLPIKRHVASLTAFSDAERNALCDALHRVAVRYDNVFETSFPYSMGFHQKPTDGREYPEWHFHAHYYPPLLRSAKVRKYMVGYEMLGMPQRDITPESAADRLRSMREEHYLDAKTE